MPFEPQLIAEARQNLGLTQNELADAIGTSQASVSKWETGAAVPSAEQLGEIYDLSYKKHRLPVTFFKPVGGIGGQVQPNPEEVAYIRGELSYSQAELGKLLGVSEATVSRWERGISVPRPEVTKRLLGLLMVFK